MNGITDSPDIEFGLTVQYVECHAVALQYPWEIGPGPLWIAKSDWDFFGRNDAKAETPVLWPLMRRADSLEKTLMLGGIGPKYGSWYLNEWMHVAHP